MAVYASAVERWPIRRIQTLSSGVIYQPSDSRKYRYLDWILPMGLEDQVPTGSSDDLLYCTSGVHSSLN